MKITLFLILILGILFISFLSSSLDIASATINQIRIRRIARSSNKKKAKKAKLILKIKQNYSMFLTSIIILNNIANVVVTTLFTYIFANILMLGNTGMMVSTLISSVVIILIGEIIPKILGSLFPEKFLNTFIYPIYIIHIILSPVTILFSKIETYLNKKYRKNEVDTTEKDLLEIIDTIEKDGVIEHKEGELIKSAINFDDKTIKSEMRSRENIIYLLENDNFDTVKNKFYECKLSRLPVLDLTLERVVGLINQKDVYSALYENKEPKIEELMHTPLYVSQRKLMSSTLEYMQKNKAHFAIVVENMKSHKFVGIITLEDLIEELVGEIYDEYDIAPIDILEIGNHILHVSGKVSLKRLFSEYLESSLPKVKAKTVNEWIKEINSDFKKEDLIYFKNIKIKILEVNDDEIEKIEIEELSEYYS